MFCCFFACRAFAPSLPRTHFHNIILFERSEFLIATSRKKNLCVCRVSCVVCRVSCVRLIILVSRGSLKHCCCRTLRQVGYRKVAYHFINCLRSASEGFGVVLSLLRFGFLGISTTGLQGVHAVSVFLRSFC